MYASSNKTLSLDEKVDRPANLSRYVDTNTWRVGGGEEDLDVAETIRDDINLYDNVLVADDEVLDGVRKLFSKSQVTSMPKYFSVRLILYPFFASEPRELPGAEDAAAPARPQPGPGASQPPAEDGEGGDRTERPGA